MRFHSNDECYVCGRRATETHHIFFGPNRKNSEKYGLTVRLCHFCHNEPPYGVHFNKELDTALKQTAQKWFSEHYNEDFMKIFGRSWL